MGYIRMTKLHNIRGRIDYVSNKSRQEKILAYQQSFSEDDVNRLVKETHEAFAKHNRYENAKCIEGRELIYPIKHEYIKTEKDAKMWCEAINSYFKNTLGVECCTAIHSASNGKNLNCHTIFFDRKKLEKPEITKEKKATRTRYFDANWKRTTKAKAVHTVKKGDIIEPAKTKYFGDKVQEFYSKDFLKRMKKELAKTLKYSEFDKSRHFPTKHIGKNNPKKKYIAEYNNAIKQINNYFDELEATIEPADRNNLTPKKQFTNYFNDQKVEKGKFTLEVIQQRFVDFSYAIDKIYGEKYGQKLEEIDNKYFGNTAGEEIEEEELEE